MVSLISKALSIGSKKVSYLLTFARVILQSSHSLFDTPSIGRKKYYTPPIPLPTTSTSTYLFQRNITIARQSSSIVAIVTVVAVITIRPPTRLGKSPRFRIRRTVDDIYQCLGPIYFRRAYRMSYESFWQLHDLLSPAMKDVASSVRRYIPKRHSYKSPPVPNGNISTSVRLGIALRYFAGGSPYDIMVKYGVSHSSMFESVWIVVEAVNATKSFDISYPSGHDEQRSIALGFKNASKVKFDCCAGAIDGILIWMHKPSLKEAQKAGVGQKKFLCGRKNKFGLNCQAVSDVRGKILDISITYGGSSSDCLAFEASDLHKRLENGLLASGLVLFGDNAYLNSNFMATPYPNVAGVEKERSKDNYNFYHSQLRIRIECAFGILVQRWGILRMAMPKGLSIPKIIALVNAVAKLHNFCIDENDCTKIPERL